MKRCGNIVVILYTGVIYLRAFMHEWPMCSEGGGGDGYGGGVHISTLSGKGMLTYPLRGGKMAGLGGEQLPDGYLACPGDPFKSI